MLSKQFGGFLHDRLMPAFLKAQNILNKMPVSKDFIRESEARVFAEEVAREVDGHPGSGPTFRGQITPPR